MKKNIILIVTILLAFAAGFLLRRPEPSGTSVANNPSEEAVAFWTCSMHPQIRQPEPGRCPICAMDLIPVSNENDENDTPRLTLSPAAERLAEIETAPVIRLPATASIRLPGKLQLDETRIARLAARVPGRIEKLYADYTGVAVQQGDTLYELYSPELLSAQQEYIQTINTATPSNPPSSTRKRIQRTASILQDKLRLWGLTTNQISAIAERSEPLEQVPFTAPLSGFVETKFADEGDYVQTGTPIYTLADPSRLWLMLEAYEQDLPFIRYGQQVAFSTPALPGQTFTGLVAFIDPVLDQKTRTVNLRVNVFNPDGRLKPGLLVQAVIHAQINNQGHINTPDFSGKWISPRHPEIVKDAPGYCDLCGIPLVSAEALGYDTAPTPDPLIIPVSAPLLTGKRAVVYVHTPNGYEGREVRLGPRVNEGYVVLDGLEEGEQVVTHGSFKIDSELQIQARPSMMSPPAETNKSGPEEMMMLYKVSPTFDKALSTITETYYDLSKSLSSDDPTNAKRQARTLAEQIKQIHPPEGHAGHAWKEWASAMHAAATTLADTQHIQAQREAFRSLTGALTAAIRSFQPNPDPVYQAFCPMAFNNQGAYWLQEQNQEINNPYYGAAMLRCGSIEGDLTEPKSNTLQHTEHHHEQD
jgi:Cu(I)/Ag(I) efflux system membrane fusion protein